MIYLSAYNYESIVDGDGVRAVLFFSGCNHNCEGCHSKHTHSFTNGKLITNDLIQEINDNIKKRPFIKGITLSGGDPMYSAKEIAELLDKLYIPNNDIWVYSGFTYEEIISDEDMFNLLSKCKYLVDGLYDYTKRDTTNRCKFRGSINQRIIDVQRSLEQDKVVLYYE